MGKLIKFKLFETITKSLFYLIVIYGFSLETSGKFGFLTVIIGLSSVFIGFERYISLQREIVKESNENTQEKLSDLIKFYLFNFIIIIPFFSIFIYLKIFDSAGLIAFTILILIIEHISNQIYNISVVYEKYIHLMVFIIIRNILLIFSVIFIIFNDFENPLNSIIFCWFSLCLLQLILSIYFFILEQNRHSIHFFKFNFKKIFNQYLYSKIHFLIGLVAILWVQLDRIIVGLWFSSEYMGIYYRHVTLIGILIQLFNITSYNRLVPIIYGSVKTKSYNFINSILLKEYKFALSFLIFLSICIVVIYQTTLFESFFVNYLIQLDLLLLLILVFSIKILADYQAIIFNAYKMERYIFRNQLISLVIALFFMFLLIPFYQIKGIIYASLISTIIYVVLMFYYKHKIQL